MKSPGARLHRKRPQVLGSNAAPAIRQLSRLALQQQHWGASRRAVRALGYVGGDSIPVLLDLSTNYSCVSRPQVIIVLAECIQAGDQTPNPMVFRTLVRCVNDRDIAVSRQAAKAVGQLKIDPALAFPALTNGLCDPNLAYACAHALGDYGQVAQPSLPALLELLNTTDSELRAEITNAVLRIEPAALNVHAR